MDEGSSFTIAMNATAPKQVATTVVYMTKNAEISLTRRASERP
jgi:predicted transcriptional regulator